MLASHRQQNTVACVLCLQVDSKYLRPIPLNTPTRIQVNGIDVMITMLDANHCPGAAMVSNLYIIMLCMHVYHLH